MIKARFVASVFVCFFMAELKGAVSWSGPYGGSTRKISLPPPDAFIGGLAFDESGRPVVFNGEAVVRLEEGSWQELYRPSAAVYGSFIKIRRGTVYFGESTNGTISAVDPETGKAGLVERLDFNTDMAFDPEGRCFVSAPSSNSTREDPKNGFYLVDLDPETKPDLVIELPGYSGPLAFGEQGELYAATASWMEPVDVLLFSKEKVAQGIGDGFVTMEEGEVIAPGVPGAYSLELGAFGLLFVSDSVTGQVLGLRKNGSLLNWAVPSGGYASATYIDYDKSNGVLGVVSSDYETFNRLDLIYTDYDFTRGEVNGDGRIDLGDAVALLGYLFRSESYHPNLDRSDVNDDSEVNIGDVVYLLEYLFAGGPQPPEPFEGAGVDPTPDELGN